MSRILPASRNIFFRCNWSRFIWLFFFVSFVSISCKTEKKAIREPIREQGADFLFARLKENELHFDWFSAKFDIDLVVDKKKNSFAGQIRIRRDSAIWISFSPALGIEVFRLLITTDSIKYLNRINNTYYIESNEKVTRKFDTNIDFDVIQSILLGNDLTYYEDGKFRATYESREYHLVTAGRSKLRKYVKTQQDAERIYIQNIFLDPESFKITKMKIKEIKKENKKLDASFSGFRKVGNQVFPHHIDYDLLADKPIRISAEYSRISVDQPLQFPFGISPKYKRIE